MFRKLTVSNSELTLTVFYDDADVDLNHTHRGLPVLKLFDRQGRQVATVGPQPNINGDKQEESYRKRINKILNRKPG